MYDVSGYGRLVQLMDPFGDGKLHVLNQVFPVVVDFASIDFVS